MGVDREGDRGRGGLCNIRGNDRLIIDVMRIMQFAGCATFGELDCNAKRGLTWVRGILVARS